MDPIFWLGLSILLVAASIAAVLLTAIPAMKELGRAAQSAERMFETINRELPPTLEAIRLTSLELTELTDDLTDGVQGASSIVQQVDGGVTTAKQQAQQATVTTKSVMAGMKAAWKTLKQEEPEAKPEKPEKQIEPENKPENKPEGKPTNALQASDRPAMPATMPATMPAKQASEANRLRLASYEETHYDSSQSGQWAEPTHYDPPAPPDRTARQEEQNKN
jgi:outer membrane biosynthesis protein TonB